MVAMALSADAERLVRADRRGRHPAQRRLPVLRTPGGSAAPWP